MDSYGEMILTKELRAKTCSSATLSTTNATWTDPGAIPGLRVEGPTTNRLSHYMALKHVTSIFRNKGHHYLKENLCDVYSSANTGQVTKARKVRWVGYIVRIIQVKNTFKVVVEIVKGNEYFEGKHGWEDTNKLIFK
jgi:hypothetical protein